MLKKTLLFLLLLNGFANLHAQVLTQYLASGWQFSESGKNEWLPATVPGTIHTDLMANGKIPDPYLSTNEAKVQWVETKTWEYKSSFDCSKEIWKQKKKSIWFEGLDTYADVYLNDTLLFTSDNMFHPYEKDVSRILKKKQNRLRIVFHPASELIDKNKSKSDFKDLPGGDRVFIRKAQYQFGWDWGPRLVTCGIWKGVRLEGWSDFAVGDIIFKTDAIQNDTAFLEMLVLFKDEFPPNKKVSVSVTDQDGNSFHKQNWSFDTHGILGYGVAINIPNPRLWWCNGMGKQEMYEFTCTFVYGKKKIVKKVRYGIRKIELDQHPDKTGSSFSFLLNDVPVFIKGANWIPCDNFLPRVTTEKYYGLLKNAQQSNMNMLRVWGGGAYEDDRFYDICDSLGIMVWQDFMFACGMYPGNLGFTESVNWEFSYQFPRINRHVSTVIWCGNNEISEGWMNWGWQKEFKMSAKDSAAIGDAYISLFYTNLKQLIRAYDRNTIYWPSSPSLGWGHQEAYEQGDVHYWGVWWGMEPFSAYDTHVGRFVSEYGFQGMPDERSFDLFAGKRYLDFNDSAVRNHQKHPTGYETITTYLKRDYPAPVNFGDYIYLSQVAQRDGMRRAIEAHRRARPYCMGTLFWQYNDCWPATSWSATDFYGRPKLFQYDLPELYAPLILSITERNDSVLIYAVNDDTVYHQGVLGFRWVDFSGNTIRSSRGQEYVPAGASVPLAGFPKNLLLDSLGASKAVLQVAFSYENGKSITALHYFTSDKNLQLADDPELTSDIEAVSGKAGTYSVMLRCKSLAKDVYLSVDDPGASFSVNGFDLMPGEEKMVIIKSGLTIEEIRKQLKIWTINGL